MGDDARETDPGSGTGPGAEGEAADDRRTEEPGAPPGAGSGNDPGAAAPGLGATDGGEDLDELPEPNEPA